jgi:hypothetical protein
MSAGDGKTIGPRIRISDPTAGAQDATFQERRVFAEIPVNTRRSLQHF